VPIVLDAPTVSTQGALPGAVMPPYCSLPSAFLPRLPAAATTVMPLSVSFLVASVSGSVQYDSWMPAPTDMLTTRMLYAFALAAIQPSAEMMRLIVPIPCESSTLSDTIEAPGAMPAFSPFESYPLPAIVPATWLPWPLSS